MRILAIDTSAELCAACVHDADAARELGREVRDIGKGHAETLMPVIAAALEMAGADYHDLDAIAVSVGPGSFTGVRIGVSAARGLALALKIPAGGVTTLAAMAFEAGRAFPGRSILPVLDARRDELYVALFDAAGATLVAPRIADAAQAASLAARHGAVLTGSGSDIVAAAMAGAPTDIAGRGRTADVAAYAILAAKQGFSGERPKPVYLRGADARPQQGFALPRRAS